MTDDKDPGSFDVVFVCTGNQARSPLAEALFRRYTAGLPTTASSYGTMDVGPALALPYAIDAADRLGVDLRAHRARTLRRARLESADLVLGFETFHVADAVVEAGADAARTFVFGELVDLLRGQVVPADVGQARQLVAAADAGRVRTRPSPSASTVGDPAGRSRPAFEQMADDVDVLVRRLVAGLFGAVEPPAVGQPRRQSRWRPF